MGQLVSILGSGLTSFAVGVRIYETSGSITQFSLFYIINFLPMTLLAPLAGALVDRWDRRRAMLLSDLGAGASTLLLWGMLVADDAGVWTLHTWHLYIPLLLSAVFDTLRWPAYYATTSLLVPKQHLGRANGMVELANGASQIVTPVLAGALMRPIGLQGIILIDLVTFVFAVGTLLAVRFPRPAPSVKTVGKPSLAQEIAVGWSFIRARPGLIRLMALVTLYFSVNAMVTLLITPLVLSFADMKTLGMVASIAGTGMLAGALVMSAWGGPRRRVRGVLGFNLLAAVALLLAALPPSFALTAAAAALFLFTFPMLVSCSQAIWQTKVAPDIQGRVFAVRRTLSVVAVTAGTLLAGPLADRVFMPMMMPGGPLAGTVGRVIGVGPGRGIALLLMILGVLVAIASVLAMLSPRLRNLEDELPDALPAQAPANMVPSPPPSTDAADSAPLTPESRTPNA